MSVASKELCQELHELSGWYEDSRDVWSRQSSGWELQGRLTCSTDILGFGNRPVPAYDLGYLVRKIADGTNAEVKIGYGLGSYAELYGSFEQHPATIPEDAACKLAISLFKQGILKRENAA